MNQQCKVCGEPAAGFHFGAFTCEGCKSFFGRSYNNLSSISECKNNSECVINKKNRTACKACRLRKCLLVGMSKSGSRYGRRSNWFKIHCLLQEQQQQQQAQQAQGAPQLTAGSGTTLTVKAQAQRTPPPPHNHPHHNHNHHNHHHHTHHALGLGLLNQQFPPPLLHLPKTKEELMLLGLDDYKHVASPSVSSPESHNSDSSVEVSDAARRMPIFPGFLPPSFLPPPNMLFPPGYPPLYPGLLQPVTTISTTPVNNTTTSSCTPTSLSNSNAVVVAAAAATNNNNNRLMRNHNPGVEAFSKRIFLDAVLQSQRSPMPDEPATPADSPVQDDPIDLSMKTLSERGSSPTQSDHSAGTEATERASDADEEDSDCDSEHELKRIRLLRPTPLDLTTKV